MVIRKESADDIDKIHALTVEAFRSAPHSDGREPQIIDALRNSGELTLSLVAETDDILLGHVAFSPVTIRGDEQSISDGSWYGLGPIAVRADRRRQRIAQKLIAEGLEQLQDKGANGVVLLGDPAIYKSSGFESDGLLRYGNIDTRFIQRIIFKGTAPSGEVIYADAFTSAI
ncbi:MAG: N-acetyltransferase [Pseudomonadota bacterium]